MLIISRGERYFQMLILFVCRTFFQRGEVGGNNGKKSDRKIGKGKKEK